MLHLKYLPVIISNVFTQTTVISDLKIETGFSADEKKYPLRIYGTAFREGKYDGITFASKHINKPRKTLVRQPVDLDHDRKNYGVVVDSMHNNGVVSYVADITDKQLADMIYDGKIKHVSADIGYKLMMPKDGVTHAVDLEFKRLSLLSKKSPVSKGTSVRIQ